MNTANKMLFNSAREHGELALGYLRANMPGFALKHFRHAVERLELTAKDAENAKNTPAEIPSAPEPKLIDV